MKHSAEIYKYCHLKYVSPEDIHVYSIDEVFYRCNFLFKSVWIICERADTEDDFGCIEHYWNYSQAGIGTNLYLAKVVMDIVAKRYPADEHGENCSIRRCLTGKNFGTIDLL